MPAGHGSAEVRGHGDWGFQLRPRPLTKKHHDIPRKITFSMSKHDKHDSDIVGTKYKPKWKNENSDFRYFFIIFHVSGFPIVIHLLISVMSNISPAQNRIFFLQKMTF